jgi:hypothetical protein
MNIERSIGAGPRRSANEACTVISNFVVEIAKERGYPDLDGIRAGFQKISGPLGVMLTTRSLGEPAISVQMPELQVQISVSYSPDWEDDLTVPSPGMLDKLDESDPIQIVLNSTGTVHQSLQERIDAASSKYIMFTLAAGGPTLPGPGPGPLPVPGPPPGPVPTLPLDPAPELGVPSVGAPEDDYLPPDAGFQPPSTDTREEAQAEPLMAPDDSDETDERGYLGRPAID